MYRKYVQILDGQPAAPTTPRPAGTGRGRLRRGATRGRLKPLSRVPTVSQVTEQTPMIITRAHIHRKLERVVDSPRKGDSLKDRDNPNTGQLDNAKELEQTAKDSISTLQTVDDSYPVPGDKNDAIVRTEDVYTEAPTRAIFRHTEIIEGDQSRQSSSNIDIRKPSYAEIVLRTTGCVKHYSTKSVSCPTDILKYETANAISRTLDICMDQPTKDISHVSDISIDNPAKPRSQTTHVVIHCQAPSTCGQLIIHTSMSDQNPIRKNRAVALFCLYSDGSWSLETTKQSMTCQEISHHLTTPRNEENFIRYHCHERCGRRTRRGKYYKYKSNDNNEVETRMCRKNDASDKTPVVSNDTHTRAWKGVHNRKRGNMGKRTEERPSWHFH